MEKIRLIGVGPGDETMLTIQARQAIDASDAVFASARHAGLIRRGLEPMEPIATVAARIDAACRAGKRVAVLVSGDPCLYSLLGLLERKLGGDRIEVLPGIGAIQTFCARMGALWQDAKVVSGHGRKLTVSALGHSVRTHEKTILFCDGERGASWAAKAMLDEGLESVRMCVGERLSYPDERLIWGSPEEIAAGGFDPLCLVWFENKAPKSGLPGFGIDDESFVRGKIPMTKREVRIQVMAEMNVRPDSIVWDVGAGTGSVSIECARACPMGEVYAIEQKAEGAELIRENARRFHVNNLTALEGKAPDACEGLPAPTHVFLGGTSGQMKAILQKVEKMHVPVRVVATAVTLESIGELTECFSDGRFENVRLSQVAVSRAEALGRYHLLKAMNPVLIASGDLKEN